MDNYIVILKVSLLLKEVHSEIFRSKDVHISNFLIVQKKVNISVSRERKEDREIKQMGQSVNNEWILINSI